MDGLVIHDDRKKTLTILLKRNQKKKDRSLHCLLVPERKKGMITDW